MGQRLLSFRYLHGIELANSRQLYGLFSFVLQPGCTCPPCPAPPRRRSRQGPPPPFPPSSSVSHLLYRLRHSATDSTLDDLSLRHAVATLSLCPGPLTLHVTVRRVQSGSAAAAVLKTSRRRGVSVPTADEGGFFRGGQEIESNSAVRGGERTNEARGYRSTHPPLNRREEALLSLLNVVVL